MDDSPIFRRIICANIVPDLADRGILHPQIQHEWSVDREARKSYLTATRDVGDGPFFMTIMHVALTCFFFSTIHLVMRPSSGMASAQRRITSGVQADTCSSVYADAGAIIASIKSAAQKVRMEASPGCFGNSGGQRAAKGKVPSWPVI